jgi:CTP synthase (UTP-ammonia lyase)
VGKRLLIELSPNSLAYKCYGIVEVEEEYYCNFGLNPAYQQLLHENGLLTVGIDPEGEARILEIKEHRFFIATLFVPQLTSSSSKPHPLILAFLNHAIFATG